MAHKPNTHMEELFRGNSSASQPALSPAELRKSSPHFKKIEPMQDSLQDMMRRLRAEPSNINLMIRIGEKCRTEGHVGEAINYFEKAAHHYCDLGFHSKAVLVLQRLIALSPQEMRYRESVVRLLMVQRKQERDPVSRQMFASRAMEELKFLHTHATNFKLVKEGTRYLRAMCELDSENVDICRELVGLLIKQDLKKDAVTHLKTMAKNLIRKRMLNEAEACLVEASKYADGHPDIKAMFFRLQVAEGFGKVGVHGLLALHREYPKNLEILNTLGSYYIMQNRPLQARDWFLKAYQLDFSQIQNLEDVGKRLIAAGQSVEAFPAYEPVAGYLVRQGQPERAVKLFLQILKVNRYHAPTLNKMFELYHYLGKDAEAFKWLERLMGTFARRDRKIEALAWLGDLLDKGNFNDGMRNRIEQLSQRFTTSDIWNTVEFSSSFNSSGGHPTITQTGSWRQASGEFLAELPSRKLFKDRLEQAMKLSGRQQKMVALLFLGLERSHRAPNEPFEIERIWVEQVGQHIKACLRNSDTLCYLGDNEYAVLLPDMDSASQVRTVGEGLIDKLSELEGEFTATGVVGAAIFPRDGQETSELMKKADIALQQARDKGDDSLVIYSGTEPPVPARTRGLERDLMRSLSHQELVLHYQPIIDLNATGMVGMEALLRWHHPELGLLLPAEFLGLATESGLLPKIGNWVLHHAVEQIRQWHKRGLTTPWLSINISREQCEDRHFRQGLQQVMNNNALPEGVLRLGLESEENLMLDPSERNLTWLSEFKNLGVSLAIDNFGSGSTSVVHLMRSPAETVKIDRSFVARMITEPEVAELVTTILEMSAKLNIKVVAEGIETAEQMEFLKAAGCPYGQGYFLSKALPPEEVEAFLPKIDIVDKASSLTYTKSFREKAS